MIFIRETGSTAAGLLNARMNDKLYNSNHYCPAFSFVCSNYVTPAKAGVHDWFIITLHSFISHEVSDGYSGFPLARE